LCDWHDEPLIDVDEGRVCDSVYAQNLVHRQVKIAGQADKRFAGPDDVDNPEVMFIQPLGAAGDGQRLSGQQVNRITHVIGQLDGGHRDTIVHCDPK
jgi:hypothetical protein